ncbi:MAG: N(G),N(G)-dimethylarginine dimethylaminohydrolase [Sandaracinaceae bacterium]|nr:N(G),N(G)-dimethylarginine dimethylaminohydrolase [Sandaracinaceae bacterium]
MTFGPPRVALVRAIPASFARALRADPAPIDVEKARAQHAAYVAALRDAGVVIEELPTTDDLPDSVFVEDPVVALDRAALCTVSAAPSRRGEAATVVEALARHREVIAMRDPEATLDGGDVLRSAGTLIVGASGRTNAAGIAELDRVARAEGLAVRAIEVRRGLHLKSAVSLAAAGWAVVDPEAVDPAAVAATGLSVIEVDEPLGANVLCLGEVTLVSASAPRTALHLRARGQRVVELELSEIHAADGALTCCSIRLAPAGAWCA